jgi:hypothetical protein
MFRKSVWQLCGLAIAMSGGTVALGQSSSSATSLNQLALRNAQQAMQQQFNQQQSGGMSSAGRIGLGLDQSYSGSKPFSGFSQGPTVSQIFFTEGTRVTSCVPKLAGTD